jgi:transcription elongation factor
MTIILKPLHSHKFGSLKVVECQILFSRKVVIQEQQLTFYSNKNLSRQVLILGTAIQTSKVVDECEIIDYKYEGDDIQEIEITNDSLITDLGYDEALIFLAEKHRFGPIQA